MDTIEATSRILDILRQDEDFIVEHDEETGLFNITEAELGILIQARVEDSIMFFQLPCIQLSREQLSAELMEKMLNADNNIWTSNFQLVFNNGTATIVLTNFAVLQELGADDEDDIKSCIQFLLEDVVAAQQLING